MRKILLVVSLCFIHCQGVIDNSHENQQSELPSQIESNVDSALLEPPHVSQEQPKSFEPIDSGTIEHASIEQVKSDSKLLDAHLLYLLEVKKQHNAIVSSLTNSYILLDKIRSFDVQENLESALKMHKFTEAQKKLYRNMHAYFLAMHRFSKTFRNKQNRVFFDKSKTVLTKDLRDWNPKSIKMCNDEKMYLPSLLMLHFSTLEPNQLTHSEVEVWYQWTYGIVGKDIKGFFAQQKVDNQTHVDAIARSMRHVKIILKLKVEFARERVPLFQNFDFTGTNAPDFKTAGFRAKIRLLWKGTFLQKDNNGKYTCNLLPWETIIASIQKNYKKESMYLVNDGFWLCPNIEEPSTFREILKKIRQEFPGMVIGIFKYVPAGGYKATHPKNSDKYKEWLAKNQKRVVAVVDLVDFFSPSRYFQHSSSVDPKDTNVQDPGLLKWKSYITRSLELAETYQKKYYHQPIIYWMWFLYHPNGDNNPWKYTYVGGDVWKEGLHHFPSHPQLDGIGIYGDPVPWPKQFVDYQSKPFKYDWYQATLDIFKILRK